MVKKRKKKQAKKFNSKMQANLLLVFCLVVGLFIALLFRIGQLNDKDGDRYAKKVLAQQTYVSSEVLYKRGDIVDRNNTKLATSVAVYDLIIDPKKILSKPEYKKPTMDVLISCFDITEEELNEIFQNKAQKQYVIVLKNIENEAVVAFEELENKEKENSKKEKRSSYIQGVWFEKKYKRKYPLDSTACDVIGFTTADNVGLWGLEGQYNSDLNGTSGREYGYFDTDLNLERTVKQAKNGNTIVTSIDANIQSIVEKKITSFMKKTGAKNVAAIVMNPNNGEVYSMASSTAYDLNNPFDLAPFYSEKEIAKMSEEEKSKKLNEIWRNYCISDIFEPGSTFKPLTVAAALEEGVSNDKKQYICNGKRVVGGHDIHCVKRYGHGALTLEGSLNESCNVVLMELGFKLGKETFEKYQSSFNFGKKTGIDLPGETTGIVFTGDRLNNTELATSSFGQGLTVSMIQIASAFSSVINGGHYYEPHVVKQIVNENGAIVKNIEPKLVRDTVSSQTSELVKKYALSTVEKGTAGYAKVQGYKIGGKTGTAQKHPREDKKYLVSFIGCAPMDNPEVVVYVIVDEPNVADQAHSTYAQEVAHDIMEDIFPFLNIFPDSKTEKEVKEENKKKKEEAKKTPEPTKDPDENSEKGTNDNTQENDGSIFGEDANGNSDWAIVATASPEPKTTPEP